MSLKERVRLDAMKRIKRRELTIVAGAELVGLSVRQMRRLWRRYQEQSDRGLVHRLRGRMSNRRMDEATRLLIIKRHQERYADFGPTLACEKLAEERLILCPNTLVGLLKERGLWQRRRGRGRHRRRRERRACFGSMIQMDGSHHDWLEGRGPTCVLMVMIDDATNRTLAWFHPAETTSAAFDVLGRWVRDHGVPRAVYVDRHSIYRQDDRPDQPTQFGRALKELGVKLICAHSPQAKGRVERRHAVFQDRLVKEMRLRKIKDLHQANALLEQTFLPEMNRRWSIEAAKDKDLHRELEAGVTLAEVLCVKEDRAVGNDWCVRWKNRWLQIEPEHAKLNLAGRRVTVRELADGRLLLTSGTTSLNARELASKPVEKKGSKRKTVLNNVTWKPGSSHPWNRTPAVQRHPPAIPATATPPRGLQAEKKKAG